MWKMDENEETDDSKQVLVLMTIIGREDSFNIRLSNTEQLHFYLLSCNIWLHVRHLVETIGWLKI